MEVGIRLWDIGSFMIVADPKTDKQIQAEMEFARLAIPIRVYIQSQFNVAAKVIINVMNNAKSVKGYEIT